MTSNTEDVPAAVPEEFVYENDNYCIIIVSDDVGIKSEDATYLDWYEVVNKVTGITEAKTPILPQAMYLAAAYDKSLRIKQYLPEEDRPPQEEKVRLFTKPTLVN